MPRSPRRVFRQPSTYRTRSGRRITADHWVAIVGAIAAGIFLAGLAYALGFIGPQQGPHHSPIPAPVSTTR
jgi:hypothetical protein